jgi:triacylglycerol lipase
MDPILFIHGFGSNDKQYQPLIRYLEQKGIKKFYEFVYDSSVGLHPIKTIAKELSEYIAENVKEENINIIGISQGGIIALAYLKDYKNLPAQAGINVKKLFTLCSPHKGSRLAKLFNLPGIIDLRPESKLLKELETFAQEEKIDIYSVYTPFDLMVFPGWNARPKYGKKKIIFAPAHPVAFFWPATKKFIYKNLNGN